MSRGIPIEPQRGASRTDSATIAQSHLSFKAGSACPFSHTPKEPGVSKQPCKWFLKGCVRAH